MSTKDVEMEFRARLCAVSRMTWRSLGPVSSVQSQHRCPELGLHGSLRSMKTIFAPANGGSYQGHGSRVNSFGSAEDRGRFRLHWAHRRETE